MHHPQRDGCIILKAGMNRDDPLCCQDFVENQLYTAMKEADSIASLASWEAEGWWCWQVECLVDTLLGNESIFCSRKRHLWGDDFPFTSFYRLVGYVSSLVDHILHLESLVNVFMKFTNLWWDTSFFCKCVTETCVWLLTDWTESSVSLGGSLHAPAGPLSVKPSLGAHWRVSKGSGTWKAGSFGRLYD